MNCILKKYVVLVIILCGFHAQSFSQFYSLKITKSDIELDTVSLSGYQTHFLQSYKEVKKAWWRYVKAKAIIENNLTHLELKIPNADRNSNTPVFLVSQLIGNDSTQFRTLKVALRTHNLDADRIADIDSEVGQMLLDFKTDYFVGGIEDKIEDQEKLSKKLSTQLDKLRSSKHRAQMDSSLFTAKENGILYGLKQVDHSLDSLKNQLLNIK